MSSKFSKNSHAALRHLFPLLMLAASSGAEPIRLTSNPADDRYPVFIPGGEKILFESNRDGNWEIYTMAAEGGQRS